MGRLQHSELSSPGAGWVKAEYGHAPGSASRASAERHSFLSFARDALIHSAWAACCPEDAQGVVRGAGKTGCLFKSRGAACVSSGHHPVILNSIRWGPSFLSAGLPRSSKPGISMYPPRVRRCPCGLRTDRTGDARAESIRASLDPHSAYRCHIFSDILHRTIAQSVMPAFLTMQNTHVQAPLASPHAACQRCHAAKR